MLVWDRIWASKFEKRLRNLPVIGTHCPNNLLPRFLFLLCSNFRLEFCCPQNKCETSLCVYIWFTLLGGFEEVQPKNRGGCPGNKEINLKVNSLTAMIC